MYPKASPPRTKGDIIGYSDEDSDDESSDKASTDNNHDEESKDDDVEFPPTISDGLGKRLRKLWKEFMREKKHEHRNETVSMNCYVKMILQETNTNN